MSKTMRRDKLLRMAKAGKLVKIESYHFDDMFGEERSNKELPVRIKSEHGDFKEGFCNLHESDFKSKVGSASLNDNGTITLYVHSNCNFDFKVVDAPEPAKEPANA